MQMRGCADKTILHICIFAHLQIIYFLAFATPATRPVFSFTKVSQPE